jgi:glutaredoxin 3
MDATMDPMTSTASQTESQTAPEVFIYSTPSCHFCAMTKAFLQLHEIPYTEFNVAADPTKRAEMIQKSGQMGVPVIVINGNLIVGYNKPKIMSLLGIAE